MAVKRRFIFNLNGGQGYFPDVNLSKPDGYVPTLPLGKPKQNGFIFDYWKSTASQTHYQPGDDVGATATTQTFTAQWIPKRENLVVDFMTPEDIVVDSYALNFGDSFIIPDFPQDYTPPQGFKAVAWQCTDINVIKNPGEVLLLPNIAATTRLIFTIILIEDIAKNSPIETRDIFIPATDIQDIKIPVQNFQDILFSVDKIPINEQYFPDENWRNFVLTNHDTGAGNSSLAHDNYLSKDEADAITSVSVYDDTITDLEGIEYYTALTELICYNNQLSNLDVSKNTALTNLACYNNQLSNLDVSKNTALTNLACFNNQLSNLDVSKNTALTELICFNNQLSNLDVSKNTALTKLWCDGNPNFKQIDIRNCPQLHQYMNPTTNRPKTEQNNLYVDDACEIIWK